MRVATPPEIDKLVEMQAPYVYYDHKLEEVVLRNDAPPEVQEARRRFLAWMEAQREV